MNPDFFLRRMRQGRLRQFAISASSICMAGLVVACLSPVKIGGFAFYSIVLLLVVNTTLALMQFQQVIRPIERLLANLSEISSRIAANDIEHIERIPANDVDAFGCLGASVDSIIEALTSRLLSLQITSKGHEDMLLSLPVAVLALTPDGKVAKILNATGLGDALRGFRIGETPTADFWGKTGAEALLDATRKAFAQADTVWCDITVAKAGGRGEALYRFAFHRISGMSVLATVADLTDGRFAVSASKKAGSPAVGNATQMRAALRRMAASVAHDGKNVFAALTNLVAANKTSTDPNVREQVPVAEDAIRRGTALMQELTGFAGETRLNLQCVPASQGLRAVIDSPSIQALVPSNVRLQVAGSDKALPEIDLDADQAWKVAMNLIKNAVEALHGGNGRITVRSEPCTMTDELARIFRHTGPLRMGEGVLVSFSDDGPGIPDEIVARLFEPYYSSKGEGRGIGLATVMTIVDAHSGAIRVKSSPGQGTTFYIYLPASRNTVQEIKMMQEIAPNGEILLVDDDPTILHTTGLVLRTLKMAAHPAASEEDAMAKLRSLRNRVKAVLVDGNLGGICSAALVRRIHGEFPDIPVVVVSGSPRETIDRQYADVAFDAFLSKPYAVSELSKVLKEVSTRS